MVRERSKSTFRLVVLALSGAAVIGSLLGCGSLLERFDSGDERTLSTYTVEKGELLITVTEDGNVESAHNIDIKCTVAGGSSILWIIADGTEVKTGDKLVELDAAALEDQINTQKIAYNKARSSVIQAEKNFSVAKISVKEYIEGTYVQAIEDAETQITIAEENLRSSKNAFDYSEKMHKRGYISELELESQQFAVKRAQLELNSANTSKKVLENFTKEKTLEDLRSQVETAKAAMESEQAAFGLEKNKLERLETQLQNCTIVAPQAGMVVYANERGGRFGQQATGIEEGAAVRDRQTILKLPDLTQMQVKVKVHETKVEEIRPNMRAHIIMQGRELLGTVTSVANQPESTSFFQGDIKEYATDVKINGTPEGLKPGMTAEVEILVAHLIDVLTLPVSCIVEQRNQFFCWTQTPNGAVERRQLELGLTNDQFVEVKSGLSEGDIVLRNPRAVVDEAREKDDVVEEEEDITEKFGKKMPPTDFQPDAGVPGAGTPGAGRLEGRPGDQGPDGPGRGPGAGGRGPGGRGGNFDLMSNDKDGDGKISKDEAPAPMQGFFDRLDANADGFIDKQEVDEMKKRMGGGGGRGPGGQAPGGQAPGGQAPEGRGPDGGPPN